MSSAATTLETAIEDLEQSTERLLTAAGDDVLALCQALEHRADAITKVAFLVEEVRTERETLARLAGALARGDEAARRVLHMKQDAIDEWMRRLNFRAGTSV